MGLPENDLSPFSIFLYACFFFQTFRKKTIQFKIQTKECLTSLEPNLFMKTNDSAKIGMVDSASKCKMDEIH